MNVQKLTKAYYYFFYKLYKWIGEENGWADWKASLAMDAFVFFFLFSFFIYYKVYMNPYIHLTGKAKEILFIVVIITVPNYLIFHHKDQWKGIIKEFDKLPDRTNNIGGAIVFAVLLFIVGNLIFSFYLMSQVDWAQYR